MFGCDREEVAITRNASESLEALLLGMDFKPGDEILSTTQDYPRMLTTLRQRERRARVILISHMVNITGQITPVRAVCEMARAKGIETIVDGAHSFAHFRFTRD